MEICRVCLSSENAMSPLREAFVVQYNMLTNLNVYIMDGLPQYVCCVCLQTVKHFQEFRERSIASEVALRKMLSSTVKSEEEVENKQVENNIQTNEGHEEKIFKNEVKEESSDTDDVAENIGLDIVCETVKDEIETVKEEKMGDIEETLTSRKFREKKKNNELQFKKQKNDTGKWLCGICPEIFEKDTDLNAHLDLHKDGRQCFLCKETMNSLSQLLAHRMIHLPNKQHKCHICKKKHKSSLYLEYHYRTLHIHSDDPKLICKTCSVSFNSPKKLAVHIVTVHSNERYVCDICSKGFKCKTSLKSHIQHHSTVKSFVCDLCGFSCNYRSGLKDHKIRKHSKHKINCRNCTRAFVNQADFDRHKCKVTLIICNICGVQLPRHSRLATHMATHSNDRTYKCDRCPATYKSKTALKVHTNKHDGNRIHQCDFCPAKFYSTTVLVKHRRIHTGERPYVCKICNKGFTGRHNLRVHMKVHGEYLVKRKTDTDSNIVNLLVK